MNRIVVKSKVGSDGVLHLALPVGMSEADQEVQVTVESLTPPEPLTLEQWHAWVDWMAGYWRGDFQRPSPGRIRRGSLRLKWLSPEMPFCSTAPQSHSVHEAKERRLANLGSTIFTVGEEVTTKNTKHTKKVSEG